MERIASGDSGLLDLASILSDAVVPASPPSVLPTVDAARQFAEERARMLQSAREDGHAQGMAQAEREIRDRVAAVEAEVRERHKLQADALEQEKQRLARLLQSIPDAVRNLDNVVAATVAELAYAAVTRVVGKQWADRDLLAGVCRDLVEENRLSPAVLRVSSEDTERFAHLPAGLQVVVDTQLMLGQCVIESEKGRLITGLDIRLDALRDALLGELAQMTVSP